MRHRVCMETDEGTLYLSANRAVWSWDVRHAGAWEEDEAQQICDKAAEVQSEHDPEGPKPHFLEPVSGP